MPKKNPPKKTRRRTYGGKYGGQEHTPPTTQQMFGSIWTYYKIPEKYRQGLYDLCIEKPVIRGISRPATIYFDIANFLLKVKTKGEPITWRGMTNKIKKRTGISYLTTEDLITVCNKLGILTAQEKRGLIKFEEEFEGKTEIIKKNETEKRRGGRKATSQPIANEIIARTKGGMTGNEIARYLLRYYGITISRGTVNKILKKAGIKRQISFPENVVNEVIVSTKKGLSQRRIAQQIKINHGIKIGRTAINTIMKNAGIKKPENRTPDYIVNEVIARATEKWSQRRIVQQIKFKYGIRVSRRFVINILAHMEKQKK